MLVGCCLAHEHRKWHKDKEVDVQELVICQIGAYYVKESYIHKLNHGVQLNELEHLERCSKSTSAFS